MHIKFNPSTAPMRLNVEVPAICGLAWIFHMYWPCSMPLLFWSKNTDPTQQNNNSTANVPKNSPKSTEIRLSHLDLLVGHQPRRPNLPELPLGMAWDVRRIFPLPCLGDPKTSWFYITLYIYITTLMRPFNIFNLLIQCRNLLRGWMRGCKTGRIFLFQLVVLYLRITCMP